jgi:hypothetical protein
MLLRRHSDLSPRRRHPITEAIENRAHELFLARGAEHGHDLDDWLQAEKELIRTIQDRAQALETHHPSSSGMSHTSSQVADKVMPERLAEGVDGEEGGGHGRGLHALHSLRAPVHVRET